MLNEALLNQIGVPGEHIQAIMDGHAATVNGIREEIELYKTEAEDLRNASAKLQAAEEKIEAIKGIDWKACFEEVQADFEAYKSERTAQSLEQKREDAYRDLVQNIVTSLSLPAKVGGLLLKPHVKGRYDLTLNAMGELKHAEAIEREIRLEWSEYGKKQEAITEKSSALQRIREGKKNGTL